MDVMFLTTANLDLLIEFEKRARVSEPEVFSSDFDEAQFAAETRSALTNPLYASARCFMCADEALGVVGRIDFLVLPSFAFAGNLRVYVDWVYVLKEARHRGIAQLLFREMEKYLRTTGIDEYFLIMADNEEAQRFYRGFDCVEIDRRDLLTKKVVG